MRPGQSFEPCESTSGGQQAYLCLSAPMGWVCGTPRSTSVQQHAGLHWRCAWLTRAAVVSSRCCLSPAWCSRWLNSSSVQIFGVDACDSEAMPRVRMHRCQAVSNVGSLIPTTDGRGLMLLTTIERVLVRCKSPAHRLWVAQSVDVVSCWHPGAAQIRYCGLTVGRAG